MGTERGVSLGGRNSGINSAGWIKRNKTKPPKHARVNVVLKDPVHLEFVAKMSAAALLTPAAFIRVLVERSIQEEIERNAFEEMSLVFAPIVSEKAI
jgi:hypothetical protein